MSVGGKTHDLTGFVTGSYFSSTENSNTNTFGEQFLNGQQGSVGKNNTQYIRCVRRYDPTTIAVNQVSSKFSLADGTTSAGNLGTLPKAGNTIIVTIAIWRSGGSGITSVTDNQGNTYQQAIIQPNVNGNANMAIYYASNIGTPTGTFTITVTPLHGFNNSLEWNAIEVSGLADSPVDRTKSAQSSAGDAATGSSAATRQMDELVVASATHSATDTNINITTAATGYTLIGINQDSQATIGYSSGYKIISTTGAQSATWSHDNTVVEGWAAGLVTFKGK